MNLREFQAKALFGEHGIVVPAGRTARSPSAAGAIARELACPVVLKPQLGVKQRGKRGAIAFCDDHADAEREAQRLFGMTVAGEPVVTLLVEARADIAEELYAAVTIDQARRCPVIMISRRGGVDIEELADRAPEQILRVPIDILHGPSAENLATIAAVAGDDVARFASTLYEVFRRYDAEIVEVNPLVRTADGRLIAVDAVLNVNDAALFRQPQVARLRAALGGGDPIADEASARMWTYIDLPGHIAILSSGAGLTMVILDLLRLAGGSAANFLDTAQIDENGIYDAFALLARAKDARGMLVNIFAGLNRCDRLAEGIVRYLREHRYAHPMVVRMVGNEEETGHRILRDAGIEPYRSLEQAIERIVALTGEDRELPSSEGRAEGVG